MGSAASFHPGTGLAEETLEFFRTDPELGESLKASFHSCTLLTASPYSVDFFGSTESVRLAFMIHGCLRSFLAETRRFGSF